MPPQNLPDADLAAIVAFIHDAKAKADSNEGNRRTVDVADLQTGNAQAGQQYFNGAGGCSKCHSPTGDLAGLANRLQGLQLFQRMLYPGGRGRGGAAPRRCRWRRSSYLQAKRSKARWPIAMSSTSRSPTRPATTARGRPNQIKVTVDNPLDAHIAQLAKYTNDDVHNVLAYLQTLK